MRQEISLGSAKAFYLDRETVVRKLKHVSAGALERFPEVVEIRLFGSLARDDQTGLSDADVFILIDTRPDTNPLERMRPYFNFFADKVEIAVDVVVAAIDEENDYYEKILLESILLARRDG